MKEAKESEIQAAICDYLALRKYFFWRCNTAPTFNWNTQSFRAMPKYAMKGVPDIILIRGGKFWGLEVKRPKGKLSADQELFRDLATEKGAEYHVVTSIDDVQKLGL